MARRTTTSPPFFFRRRFGFTLVELMIAIVVIAILGCLLTAMGLSAQVNAKRRSTRAILHSLESLMAEYLAAGNPEPQGKTPSGVVLPDIGDGEIRWVQAFYSTSDIASKLSNYTTKEVQRGGNNYVLTIVDSFGRPIRYVPSNIDSSNGSVIAPGYFRSAGPDGVFGIADDKPGDDLFSTDPL